jgi:uncharacterized protein (TIRG00374 family)
MEPVKYKATWQTFVFPLIGLVAFFAYILLFNVNLQRIVAEIQRVNLSLYILAAAMSIFDTLFFALAWHSLLSFLSVTISRFKAFVFVWVGIFVDTLIPAESVSGEIAKIYLINREQSGKAGRATGSVVAHRLISMGINASTLLVGVVLLLIENRYYGIITTLTLFLVSTTFLFLVLTLLLCVKENWTMRILDAVIRFAERISRGRWRLNKVKEETIEAAKAFHQAMKEYAHAPKTLIVASSLSIVSWTLTLVVLYLTFLSIGYAQISLSAILVTSAIFAAVKSVPIGVPFEVGLPEITLTTLFFLFGVPVSIGATATLLLRFLTLWLRFFIGFASEQWIGIKGTVASESG